MKKKVILSVLVILFVAAISLGGTMAWFTAEAEITPNVFTAGTVILEAKDSWQGNSNMEVDKWNPGDCSPKYVAVEYKGNKNAFIRMQLTMGWEGGLSNRNVKLKKYVGTDYPYSYFVDTNTGKWTNVPNNDLKAWFANDNYWVDYDLTTDWVLHEGWYYYKGGEGPFETTIGSTTINSLNPEEDAKLIPIFYAVCLDGGSTGNTYQGKKLTITAKFQAIQGSHADEWNWNAVNFQTGL